MTDIPLIVGALALAGLFSLALLACAVYVWLAVLEAAGVVDVGSADLVVWRCIEPNDRSAS